MVRTFSRDFRSIFRVFSRKINKRVILMSRRRMKTFGVFRSIYSGIRHLKIMMDEMSRLLCTLPHWVLRRLLSPHTVWKFRNFTLIIFFLKKKKFVKMTFLLIIVLWNGFTNFSSESKLLLFPHCVTQPHSPSISLKSIITCLSMENHAMIKRTFTVPFNKNCKKDSLLLISRKITVKAKLHYLDKYLI